MSSALADQREGSTFLGINKSTTLQFIIRQDLHAVGSAQHKRLLLTPIFRKQKTS